MSGPDEMQGARRGAMFVVVVGVDLEDRGTGVLLEALALLEDAPRAELHVVHVLGPRFPLRTSAPPADERALFRRVKDLAHARLDALCAPVARRLRGHVLLHLRIGAVAHEIALVAREVGADRVVVGVSERRGIGRVLHGAIAERVVRSSPCPVLVVRAKDADADSAAALRHAFPRSYAASAWTFRVDTRG